MASSDMDVQFLSLRIFVLDRQAAAKEKQILKRYDTGVLHKDDKDHFAFISSSAINILL